MSTRLPLTNSMRMYEDAKRLIPGGMMGIRRPYNFVPGEYPIFLARGQGGRVTDVDGNEYVDFLCAYGPIILGYREAEVDDAAIDHIRENGFCFSLVHETQNTLIETLRRVIPCCEMGFTVKTGSDATTAAIRVARGFTGKLKILRCGYHGWHDWCVEVHGGVPQKLYEDTHEFAYNRLDELDDLLKRHAGQVAAIIVTPVGHPLAHPVEAPAPGFLEGVRELANRHECVLIFDEIRSGFRVAMGGAQERYGVTPDLATFGKAMANGWPIAAVVGRADVMRVVEKEVFVSSTYFPNSSDIVAALKTIEILERDRVLDAIWSRGEAFLARLRAAVEASGVDAHVSGVPPMPFITFPTKPDGTHKDQRTRFYTEVIRRGVFLQPYHHGYICWRHTQADLDQAVGAVEEALAELRRNS
ncbi:MAG: aminotransferase class III-fold pyridoxal phosphate-dependent enzyme [Deltaproteobacteria bacterium]|nr:aminotransferase class III-fold pyridoxal phosphate-dependent enzyme [Deltaproteobacteria bacterium]